MATKLFTKSELIALNEEIHSSTENTSDALCTVAQREAARLGASFSETYLQLATYVAKVAKNVHYNDRVYYAARYANVEGKRRPGSR